MNKFEPMISRQEAFDIIDGILSNRQMPSESIPTRAALGRVLAKDQFSQLELPPFDKSAMDGYAIMHNDSSEKFRILETVAAGSVGEQELEVGTCVQVMTGAPVPANAGKVIKIEDTEEVDGCIKITNKDANYNICKKAEDITIGQKIIETSTTISAIEIANLIACGIQQVDVFKRIRLAILSTGDEIVDDPEQIRLGKIMNSNGPMLAALAKESGFETVIERSLPDDLDATLAGIQDAIAAADVVILSGGVSVGEFDFVLESLDQAGLKTHFSRVAVQPGKPTVFASTSDTLVFGLPGNPVSVFLMFHIFVRRAMAKILGQSSDLKELTVKLEKEYRRRKTERLLHAPCFLTPRATVMPIEYHGSAHLAALMKADGIFVVPVGTSKISAGEEVVYTPIPKSCSLQ
jgi:molybdopterin molybdotransferase